MILAVGANAPEIGAPAVAATVGKIANVNHAFAIGRDPGLGNPLHGEQVFEFKRRGQGR